MLKAGLAFELLAKGLFFSAATGYALLFL